MADLTSAEQTLLDNMCPLANQVTLGTRIGNLERNLKGTDYYVDKWDGSDSNDGLSWGTAFATIAKAISIVNGLIDWSNYPKAIYRIWISPGVYAEALISLPYDCRMIGTGIPGTDQCTEIAPAAGSALKGTALGLHLYNLRFEGVGAVPVLDFGVCNSTIIENCEIANGADYDCTHGISIENSDHLIVKNCVFGSGFTALTHAIYAAGGADKYLHHAIIENNWITAGIGIYIAANCTANNTVIRNNEFNVTTLAIDDDSNDAVVTGNKWISAAALASSYDINLAKAAGNIATGNDNTLAVPICAV